MNDQIHELKEEEHVHMMSQKNTMGGLILIGLGLVFLMSQMGWLPFMNWWALFILLPAACSASTAWDEYQQHGVMTPQAKRSIVGAVFMGLIASSFLFGISFNLIWPLFLLLGGVMILWDQRS